MIAVGGSGEHLGSIVHFTHPPSATTEKYHLALDRLLARPEAVAVSPFVPVYNDDQLNLFQGSSHLFGGLLGSFRQLMVLTVRANDALMLQERIKANQEKIERKTSNSRRTLERNERLGITFLEEEIHREAASDYQLVMDGLRIARSLAYDRRSGAIPRLGDAYGEFVEAYRWSRREVAEFGDERQRPAEVCMILLNRAAELCLEEASFLQVPGRAI
jgi:hypothetical protein